MADEDAVPIDDPLYEMQRRYMVMYREYAQAVLREVRAQADQRYWDAEMRAQAESIAAYRPEEQ